MSEEAEIFVVRATGESIRLSPDDARVVWKQLSAIFGGREPVPVAPVPNPWWGIVPPGPANPMTGSPPYGAHVWMSQVRNQADTAMSSQRD